MRLKDRNMIVRHREYAILTVRKVRAHKGGHPSYLSDELTLQTKERRAGQ